MFNKVLPLLIERGPKNEKEMLERFFYQTYISDWRSLLDTLKHLRVASLKKKEIKHISVFFKMAQNKIGLEMTQTLNFFFLNRRLLLMQMILYKCFRDGSSRLEFIHSKMKKTCSARSHGSPVTVQYFRTKFYSMTRFECWTTLQLSPSFNSLNIKTK